MLALDANILIRAVLGKKVSKILTAYMGVVPFFVADAMAEEARLRLPEILADRRLNPQPVMKALG
ncbi:MAG: hypothetical protein JO185_18240, partial [Acidobacteriaceae bacterium]|nr:hypothetical protein [Acidobacteriaceae bacterium]